MKGIGRRLLTCNDIKYICKFVNHFKVQILNIKCLFILITAHLNRFGCLVANKQKKLQIVHFRRHKELCLNTKYVYILGHLVESTVCLICLRNLDPFIL